MERELLSEEQYESLEAASTLFLVVQPEIGDLKAACFDSQIL